MIDINFEMDEEKITTYTSLWTIEDKKDDEYVLLTDPISRIASMQY